MDNATRQITTLVRADRLRLASYFTSRSASRQYLRGVLIEPAPEGVALVGADGHKLGAFDDPAGFTIGPRVVVLPQHALNRIENLDRSGYRSWFAILDGIGDERAIGVLISDPGHADRAVLLRDILSLTARDIEWLGRVELIRPQDLRWRAMLRLPTTPGIQPITVNGADLAPFLAVAKQARSAVTVVGDGSTPYLVDCGRPDFVGVISPVLFQKLTMIRADDGYLAPAWARPLPDDAPVDEAQAVAAPTAALEQEAA